MKPSELVPGTVYVVNKNGYRRNAVLAKVRSNSTKKGGLNYVFKYSTSQGIPASTIELHESHVETCVEYPRYTQLALKFAS